ncbi:MAG: ACP phosphodiesterase [Pseudomonadota bacterium]
MNYLAHVYFSGPDPQWQLGGYLGDHVRGDAWRDYAPDIARGILLHRRVDVFTDTHPAFAEARGDLDAPFRRYAGILLDMFFDHFLAADFHHLTGRHLGVLAAASYANLRVHRHLLPASLQRFATYQESHNLLRNYADPDYLAMALGGLSQRLKRANPLADGITQLAGRRERFKALFADLFADLDVYAREQRRELSQDDGAYSKSQPVIE